MAIEEEGQTAVSQPEDWNSLSVPERLRAAAALYEDRNAIYGNDYKKAGGVLLALFPRGLELQTAGDFGRFALLLLCLSKIGRYAAQWTTGGHPPSLEDLSVYAAMLNEYDSLLKRNDDDIPF